MSRLVKRSLMGTLVATAMGVAALTQVGGEEGLRLKTYKDIVGVPTYCYGETKGAQMGQVYTKAQCDKLLLARLDEFATKVEACVKKPMSERTEVAFVSFAYNIGVGGFCKSSAVRLYNEGKFREGCQAMIAWSRAGRHTTVLRKRRLREINMCVAGL